MTNAWRQIRRMKRLAVGSSTTPEYIEWLNSRINDNIPVPSQGDNQLAEKHVRVVPSELEIIRHDFERRNSELEKKIEQTEEEKMNLKLDIDVQKLETEGLRKGKRKAEEDLNSLKTDYKRLRLLVRTAGLGKSSEQWRQEVEEEKAKAGRWEKRFQEAQTQNKSLERSLSESQNERDELKARVAELEKTVHQYRNHNIVMELQASLSRIEQMKRTVEGLEIALQNCEARIEHLEANKDHQSEQLHYLQDQVAKRDHIMGEAVVQIQGVAKHLQNLAIQADILSVKYESESDQGQKLASLLREIKVLSVRAKPYL
ncbi:tropomyosin-2-like [Gossypium raimondii]|uniref:tropomyosin-2-like n=1 Tax=Gossypium raimondii TaxID=29730 RepID=UPI00063B03D2|nr:tropomyosin-2-like [Gossypium raimondii]